VHPLIALLAIFGGLELSGLAGVFVGPVVAPCAPWGLDVYGRSKPE
jgi:predicted PurR-regulated permease PerM